MIGTYGLEVTDLVYESYDNSRKHGFWTGPENANIPTKIALIHSEASEALECFRNGDMATNIDSTTGKPEGLPSELADIVIRVADLCGYLGIDLAGELQLKLAFNRGRDLMHGGKRV